MPTRGSVVSATVRLSSRLGFLAALVLAIGGIALAAIAGAEDQTTVRQGVYDTEAPRTKITSGPKDKTEKRKATFKFTSNESGSSFVCKLDHGQPKPCDSPKRLNGLETGKHKFKVTATDSSGNADATPAKYGWKIVD